MELVGIVVLCFFSILAKAAGTGGGPFNTAVALAFFGYGAKGAIALSNGIMFLNGLGVTLISLNYKNPVEKHKPLIDMNLTLLVITPMMAGSFLGSIVDAFRLLHPSQHLTVVS
jgi:uncharacterized membrane protein YfcA